MAKNWAIVIGINHYEHHPEKRLRYAVRDAELMRDFLIGHAQFEPNQVICCLGDEVHRNQPTYPSCGNLLRWINRELHPSQLGQVDRFWFFFSGHGISENGQDYLIACDGLREDQKRFALSIDEVTAALRLHRDAEIVLILDQCREQIGSKDLVSRMGAQTLELAQQRGITTIFSCDYGQYSYELETIQCGAFTYALVEGLRQHTLPAQLEPYLQRRVRELHQQAHRSTTQLPTIHLDSAQKANVPLLPDSVTITDIAQLTEQAVDALFANDLDLSERLWELVNDCATRPQERRRAIAAIKQIATLRQQKAAERLRQQQQQQQEAEQQQQRQEAERLRLQQAQQEAERQQQREEAEQQRQREEAERLRLQQAQQEAERQRQLQQQQEEAERLRFEQEEAERLQQQQEAERLRRQQQEAERRQQAAERQRTQANVQPPVKTSQPGTRFPDAITRQQLLKWAGFSGGGVVLALIGNQLIQNSQSPSTSPLPPASQTGKELSVETVDFETIITVDEQGKPRQRKARQAKLVKEDLDNGVTLDLVYIPGGEFLMGTANQDRDTIIRERTRHGTSQADAEKWTGWEMPQHSVTVSEFWMGMYAVTQAQYEAVMGENPANFKGAKRPIEQVSWEEAEEFCQRLSRKTGRTYRLPSEAEWEYACRAGTTTPFHFGSTITPDLVNYDGNYPYGKAPKGEYRQATTEVGSFPPNAFGLYDMHGNVWEWCADRWHENYQGAPIDGSVWETGGDDSPRLLRGGSWLDFAVYCRSAYRSGGTRDPRYYSFGFRVVLSAPWTL